MGSTRKPIDAQRGGRWTAPLLAIVVGAAFAPTVSYGFVNWDDPLNFTQNPYIRGLGWPHIEWAWTTSLADVYQPLAWMLVQAEFAVWGLNPAGYHVVSVVLQVLNALVLAKLLVVLQTVGRQDPDEDRRPRILAATTAAALFAVHPQRVEVVAWISCQPYLPSALCAMLSTLAYLQAFTHERAGRHGSWVRWPIVALLLYAAALLFKSAAVGLALVFVVLDVYPLRRIDLARPFRREAARVWFEKLPFLLVAALLSARALAARPTGPSAAEVPPFGALARAGLAAEAVALGLAKAVWPFSLSAFYPLPAGVGGSDRNLWAGLLVVALLSAGAIAVRRRWPGVLVAWASYLILLAPTLPLGWASPWLTADRYTYLPAIPLAALVAGALSYPRKPGVARAGLVAVWVIVLILTGLTWRQDQTWRDSLALWEHVQAEGTRHFIVETNHASALREKGRLAEAATESAGAIALRPESAVAHNNHGSLLAELGRGAEAHAEFLEAVRLDPGLASAQDNLGLDALERGQLTEAADRFALAVRLRPDSAEFHSHLGEVLLRLGKLDPAIDELTAALALDPGHAMARQLLAEALRRKPQPRLGPGSVTGPF